MEGGIPPYFPNNINNMTRTRYIFFYLIVLSAFLMSSCMDESSYYDVNTNSAKIINEMTVHDDNTLMFKLGTPADAVSLEELTSNGLINVRKLFTSTPGKEALEARFGLDRWYVAEIADGMDLSDVAVSLADASEVALVQYNTILNKASDCIVYSYDGPDPETKAT